MKKVSKSRDRALPHIKPAQRHTQCASQSTAARACRRRENRVLIDFIRRTDPKFSVEPTLHLAVQ